MAPLTLKLKNIFVFKKSYCENKAQVPQKVPRRPFTQKLKKINVFKIITYEGRKPL